MGHLDDYLDPDIHLWPQTEDYGYEELVEELKKLSSGRWDYDKIDCCLTGKDADLEPHGQQGLALIDVNDEFATVILHLGATIGCEFYDDDLEGAENLTDEQFDQLSEAYKDVIQEIVIGSNMLGDWTGDDWYLKDEATIKVPVILDEEEGKLNFTATAEKICDTASKYFDDVLAKELVLIHEVIHEFIKDFAKNWKQYL